MKYVIAATARSGSSILGDHLRNTQVLGNPGEILNSGLLPLGIVLANFRNDPIRKPVNNNDDDEATPPRRYRADAFRLRRYCNHAIGKASGIFGVKVLAPQFFAAGAFEQEVIHETLLDTDKFIFLVRNDKAKQAISRTVAMQSGSWSSTQPARRKGLPIYSFSTILSYIYRTQGHEKSWEAYFAQNKITPLRTTYEAFMEDKAKVVKDIAEYLGAGEYQEKKGALRLVQDNASKKDFLERFLADYKETFGIDYYDSTDYGRD
jgi:LPS sulfotransferase NodH